jgi:UDP-N-acetylglucosamine acyltransferase
MNKIHPTAIISNKAELGENIEIGPYVIIEDDVEIGDNCYIGSHSVIYNGARIKNRVKIFQSASVANLPQDFTFQGETSLFIVDEDTIIREFVTLHRGTKSTGFSKVGKNCYLMAYSHVAHDTTVGDNCILSNGVQLGGHVTLEDYVIIGGLTPVHQFCKVGRHTMIGGGFRITQDVPPYILAASEPLKYSGINSIGLRRRGFTNDDIFLLKKAYGFIYSKALNVSQAKEKIINEIGLYNVHIKNIIDFLNESKRGLIGK